MALRRRLSLVDLKLIHACTARLTVDIKLALLGSPFAVEVRILDEEDAVVELLLSLISKGQARVCRYAARNSSLSGSFLTFAKASA